MANTEPLNFRISPDLKRRIGRYQRHYGLTQAQAVRLLLDKALTLDGIPRETERDDA